MLIESCEKMQPTYFVREQPTHIVREHSSTTGGLIYECHFVLRIDWYYSQAAESDTLNILRYNLSRKTTLKQSTHGYHACHLVCLYPLTVAVVQI